MSKNTTAPISQVFGQIAAISLEVGWQKRLHGLPERDQQQFHESLDSYTNQMCKLKDELIESHEATVRNETQRIFDRKLLNRDVGLNPKSLPTCSNRELWRLAEEEARAYVENNDLNVFSHEDARQVENLEIKLRQLEEKQKYIAEFTKRSDCRTDPNERDNGRDER